MYLSVSEDEDSGKMKVTVRSDCAAEKEARKYGFSRDYVAVTRSPSSIAGALTSAGLGETYYYNTQDKPQLAEIVNFLLDHGATGETVAKVTSEKFVGSLGV
jgi:hypothetical protein